VTFRPSQGLSKYLSLCKYKDKVQLSGKDKAHLEGPKTSRCLGMLSCCTLYDVAAPTTY